MLFWGNSGKRVGDSDSSRPIPRIYGTDTQPRIVVRGWQAGKKVQLTIAQKNDPLEIWNALTEAGAVPGSAWITPTGEA